MPTEKQRIVDKIKAAQNGDAYRQAKEAFILLDEVRDFLQSIYVDVIIEDDGHITKLCDLMVNIDSFLGKP